MPDPRAPLVTKGPMADIAIASPMLPPNLVLRGGIEDHRQFLEANGYRGGIELHVTRFARLVHEIAARSLLTSIDGSAQFIRSGHQSYISREPGMVPHGNPGKIVRAMAGVAIFPCAEPSLRRLSKLQAGICRDRSLSVVVYPEIDRSEGFDSLPFAEKLFQPNIRVLKKWGVRSADDLVTRAMAAGLTGIAWDGYHYLRVSDDGLHMPDWRETLPQFLDKSSNLPVREVHVSIGRSDRTDQSELSSETRRELSIFLGEPNRISTTETGQMLRMIHEATGGSMRYVVESRFSKNEIPTGMTTSDAYITLAQTLTSYLDNI